MSALGKRRSLSMDRSVDNTEIETAEDLIGYFKNLSPTKAKTRGLAERELNVEKLVKISMSSGLSSECLDQMMDIIIDTNNHLAIGLKTKFIKCLIPNNIVWERTIVKAIAFISVRIFPVLKISTIDLFLVRWILLVLDMVDSFEKLHLFYGVIFNFIYSTKLLPHACHLLFILTEKKDVRLYRVQALLKLKENMGPQPYLIGLLSIFKVFCPHLVPMTLEKSSGIFFKPTDRVWRQTIVDSMSQSREERSAGDDRVVQERQSRMDTVLPSKKRKTMIPGVHNDQMEIEPEKDLDVDRAEEVLFTQIYSFTSFLQFIDRIKHPSQAVACLNDEKLQLLLSIHPDPLVLHRLCFWIQHFFIFGFENSKDVDDENNIHLLEMLYKCARTVPHLSDVIERFLTNFIQTWDGLRYGPQIFSLITCIKPKSFEALYSNILEPVRLIYNSGDVYMKTSYINALIMMMRNMVSSFWPTASQGSVSDNEENREVALPLGMAKLTETLSHLVKYMDLMLVLGMRMENDHYILQLSALQFLSLVSELFTVYRLPILKLPMYVIQRLMFTDCLAVLSELCSVICKFRESYQLQSYVTNSANQEHSLYLAASNMERTDKLLMNRILGDMFGMLFKGSPSRNESLSSVPSLFNIEDLPSRVEDSTLSIYHGQAFLPLVYKFFTETQPEGKKLNPNLIPRSGMREKYLDYLERENFSGIKEFLHVNQKR